MKKYIGTKEVKAQPMTAYEASQKGYKTGESDRNRNGYEVEYKDGYKSWCPAEPFEEAYKCAETHADRMRVELAELTEKLDKLSCFFETGLFKMLSIQKQNLLQAQFGAMLAYSQTLAERIRLEEEPNI